MATIQKIEVDDDNQKPKRRTSCRRGKVAMIKCHLFPFNNKLIKN